MTLGVFKKTIFGPFVHQGGIVMRFSTQVKPISYLKANAAEVLAQIAAEREPLVITQNGEAKAVLQEILKGLGYRAEPKPAAEVIERLRAKRAAG